MACQRRRAGEVRRRDDRRQRRSHRQGRGPRAFQRSDGEDRPAMSAVAARSQPVEKRRRSLDNDRLSRRSSGRPLRSAAPAAASPTTAKNSIDIVERGLEASPVCEVLIEESVLGWKEYRDGGDARPRRQRRHHLLDRKLRSDGRPHRRFDHGRAGADADRQRISDDARRLARRHPRDRRRDGRLEYSVRDQSGQRRA